MAESAGDARGEAVTEIALGAFVRTVAGDEPVRDRVDVAFDPGAEGVRLVAPMVGLGLALRAILKNAIDASPPGTPPSLRVTADAESIRLEVRDAGAGIAPVDLPRVVEPFYTTKPPGKGMGLGLFLADNVMRRMNGRLVLKGGEGGKGTRACLEWPRAEGRAAGGAA
jgi:two-component system sensor histidine kinase RegB